MQASAFVSFSGLKAHSRICMHSIPRPVAGRRIAFSWFCCCGISGQGKGEQALFSYVPAFHHSFPPLPSAPKYRIRSGQTPAPTRSFPMSLRRPVTGYQQNLRISPNIWALYNPSLADKNLLLANFLPIKREYFPNKPSSIFKSRSKSIFNDGGT